jgi:hypothetical protein
MTGGNLAGAKTKDEKTQRQRRKDNGIDEGGAGWRLMVA